MRVLVTGANGTVGAHTAAALQQAGHELRLFARSADRLRAAMEPLGVTPGEIVIGDVRERRSLREAMRGCDAVVHAAGVVSFNPGRDTSLHDVNVLGTERVLESAVELGLEHVVHVSSICALAQRDGRVSAENEPAHTGAPYAKTKAAAERIARRMQAEGAPITITYPGGVIGPDDPSNYSRLAGVLGQVATGVGVVFPSGVPLVDARDVALVHTRILERGQPGGRYMIGGAFLSYPELSDHLAALTGREIKQIPIPGWVARPMGRLLEVAHRVLGVDIGEFTHEAMVEATRALPVDDSATLSELCIDPRPIDETLASTLLSMREKGLIEEEHLGSLRAALGHREEAA